MCLRAEYLTNKLSRFLAFVWANNIFHEDYWSSLITQSDPRTTGLNVGDQTTTRIVLMLRTHHLELKSMTSPIAINVPSSELLAAATKSYCVSLPGNLNNRKKFPHGCNISNRRFAQTGDMVQNKL